MPKPPMLIVALVLVHFTLGGLSLIAARDRERMPSVHFWGWGMILYASGLLLTIADALIGRAVAHTIGNLLIAGSALPLVQGMLGNSRHRIDRRWAGSALAVTLLVLIVNNFGGYERRLVDLVSPSPFAVVMFLYGGIVLWHAPPPAARHAARLLALGMLACSALWSLRAILLFTGAGGGDPERTGLIVDLFSIAQILFSVIGMLCLFWIEVLKMEDRLSTMAYGDSLTGLPNRRATVMRFQEMASAARRAEHPFSLMLFDIDFFKRVNDTYGHQAGDAVLKHLASVLTAAKRQEDLLGRVGGEEFVLLLADTGLEGAQSIAERMRELVAESCLQHDGKRIAITISGGLAQFPEDGGSWDRMYNAADRRLYQAKSEGRNRIATDG